MEIFLWVVLALPHVATSAGSYEEETSGLSQLFIALFLWLISFGNANKGNLFLD